MIHVVKKGDTLSQIAVDYHTTVDLIMASNPHIKDRNFIREGSTIYVPALTDYTLRPWQKLWNWYKSLFTGK